MSRVTAAICAAFAAALVASPSSVDARVERGSGLASKKAVAAANAEAKLPFAARFPTPLGCDL